MKKILSFSVLLIFSLTLIIFLVNSTSASALTTCFYTKLGLPPGDKPNPPECQSSGGIPSADRVALLEKIKSYVDQGKIVFAHPNDKTGMTNGTGIVKRKDGADITIDTQILRVLVAMADRNFTFSVSSMIGTHAQYVSGSNRQSAHWTGKALDINVINGKDIDTGGADAKPATMEFMKALNSLSGSDLEPKQIICSGNGRIDPEVLGLQKGVNGVIAGHENHVHLGY